MFIGELLSSIVFVGIGFFVYFMSHAVFPEGTEGTLGPGFFPGILSVVLVGLGIFQICITFKKHEQLRKYAEVLPNWRNVFSMLLSFFLCFTLIPFVGFIPSIILLLVGIMVLCGERHWIKILIISSIMFITIYLFFGKLLHVMFSSV